MPLGRNDERRTNNNERNPMTDAAKNLSFLTPTSVMNSLDSTSYLMHIHTPPFAHLVSQYAHRAPLTNKLG